MKAVTGTRFRPVRHVGATECIVDAIFKFLKVLFVNQLNTEELFNRHYDALEVIEKGSSLDL